MDTNDLVTLRVQIAGTRKSAFEEIEGAPICPTCFQVHGRLRVRGYRSHNYWQKCACERSAARDGHTPATAGRPEEPRSELSTYFELCRCCTMEPLRSLSRWSVWFCEECKTRVREFNNNAGPALIPIGRHSVMNGLGLSLDGATDPDEIARFTASTNGLFAKIGELLAWTSNRVRNNLRALEFAPGTEIALAAYLTSANRLRSRSATPSTRFATSPWRTGAVACSHRAHREGRPWFRSPWETASLEPELSHPPFPGSDHVFEATTACQSVTVS